MRQCVLPAVWELYVGTRPWAGMRHVQVIAQKMRGLGSLDFPPGTPAQYEASRHWTVHSCLARCVSIGASVSWLVSLDWMRVHTGQAPARYLLVYHALMSCTPVQCLLITGF